MAEKEPARPGPRKVRPNPESAKKSYEARQPTPTETAKDEHIASLKDGMAYHQDQCRLVRIELQETRSSHALEISRLRDSHGDESAGLREELGRLKPEVSRLRESLGNLKAGAGFSAAVITIGGTAVSAAGQFRAAYQLPITVGGFVAVVCGVLFLAIAALRSKPSPD